jgi:hypothetical protein
MPVATEVPPTRPVRWRRSSSRASCGSIQAHRSMTVFDRERPGVGERSADTRNGWARSRTRPIGRDASISRRRHSCTEAFWPRRH